MEPITAWVMANGLSYLTGIVGAFIGATVVGWILKKIPMEKFQKQFGKFMYGAGNFCTLGLSSWKYTKKFWNKTLEPFFIHFIRDVVIFGVNEFIRGLESDNG